MTDSDQNIEQALARLEELKDMPCWGPNENGDLMIDYELQFFREDLEDVKRMLLGTYTPPTPRRIRRD